jgi:bacillithiol biosynthesis deacetylase BshB1
MQLDILAFGAHPDDVELYAAGTLAKMAARGYAVGIVDMTRGELGTRGTPALRAREAKESARVLGLKVRENLGLPDGRIPVTPQSRLLVIRMLRKYRPGIVLVHHWDERHPDHTSTSHLVTQAAHHAGLARIQTGQKRFRPDSILYYMLPAHQLPSFVVDVSDFTEQRQAAIRSYRSQLFDPESREPATYLSHPDFLTQVENIHSYYGALIGKARGEGFYTRGVLEVPDPVDFFNQQARNRLR